MKFYLKNPTRVFMNTKFLVIRFMVVITATSSFFVSCDDDISDVGGSALIGSELTIEENIYYNEVDLIQQEVSNPRTNNLNYYLLGDKSNGFTTSNYSIIARFLGLENPPENTNNKDDDDDETYTTTVNKIVEAKLVIPYIYTNEPDNDAVDSQTSVYSISKIEPGETGISIDVYDLDYLLQDENIQNGGVQEYFADGTDSFFNPVDVNRSERKQINASTAEITLPSPDSSVNNFTVDLYDDENESLFETYEINQNLGDINTNEIIEIPLNDEFVSKLNDIIVEDEDGFTDISIFSNEDLYKEFLKSIYITTSNDGGIAGVMPANSSFYKGGIELTFNTTKTVVVDGTIDEEESSTDQDPIVTVSTLLFADNPINIITKQEEEPIESTNNIILQSGLGSFAKVNLFSDSSELSNEDGSLLKEKVLLNEAILRFTADVSIYDTSNTSNYLELLPENIIIYNLDDGNISVSYTHLTLPTIYSV